MAGKRRKRSNRNKETAKCKISITTIRDWIGFILTIIGFFLSLSGTVHVDVQIQHDIDIEFHNNFNKEDQTQWILDIYPVNLDDFVDTENKDTSDKRMTIFHLPHLIGDLTNVLGAFYCVTKSREPTTNESDMFSALVCTLFVSVDDKLL